MNNSKKNILFIINNLNVGGAEKALVSLLQTFDYNKYNVDLFVFNHEGIFFESIPKQVKILPPQKRVPYFYQSSLSALLLALKKFDYKAIYSKLMHIVLSKYYKSGVLVEQYFWKHYSVSLEKLEKKYDVAIGFQEKNPIYFCIDKVNATKKIGWIHTDLETLGIDFNHEKHYFNKLDKIVLVSQGLQQRLSKKLPQFALKIVSIENIISKKTIQHLAEQKTDFIFNQDTFNILFVGRIAQEKGLFLALDALEILVNKGYKINWYLIGEGNKKQELIAQATAKNILQNIHFLGLKNNPYPYIKQADMFILPSFYEGKSISLEEAKLLCKPIVITNFSSANDQIQDGKNGFIAQMNPQSIAQNIEKFLQNKELQNQFSLELFKSASGNEKEIEKLYQLIENE